MTFVATWPCLKRISVGIERTSYCAEICGFSSVLSLTTLRSSRSALISSRIGATMRHGPHHGAQKSTSTGVSASRTSAWKLVSVTSLMLPAMSAVAPVAGGRKVASESIVPGSGRSVTDRKLPGQRQEKPRRDPHLDGGGRQEDRDRQRDRHEGGGQQLVPAAAAARDRPRRQRHEQREQLRHGVQRKRADQLSRGEAEL